MEGNEFFFDVSSFFCVGDIGEEKTNTTKQRNRRGRKNYYFVQEKLGVTILFFLRVKSLLCVFKPPPPPRNKNKINRYKHHATRTTSTRDTNKEE